jgi:hypothetical protein
VSQALTPATSNMTSADMQETKAHSQNKQHVLIIHLLRALL